MKPETKQYLAYKLRRIARDRQIRDKFKKKNDQLDLISEWTDETKLSDCWKEHKALIEAE